VIVLFFVINKVDSLFVNSLLFYYIKNNGGLEGILLKKRREVEKRKKHKKKEYIKKPIIKKKIHKIK
jgi:hypothetical protein